MVLVRAIYAVILVQIVLGVFQIVSCLLHVTGELMSCQSGGVACRLACVARGSVCVANPLPSVSDATGKVYGDAGGVTARFACIPDDPGFGADCSLAGASRSGNVLDRPWRVAAEAGCVAGVSGVHVVSSGIVRCHSRGVADRTGAVAGVSRPCVVSLPRCCRSLPRRYARSRRQAR